MNPLVRLLALLFAVREAVRQMRCKHEQYRETMACDAICVKCGRNLGFIQNLRDRDRRAQEKKG